MSASSAPPGCGKSTTLKLIAGLDFPTSGSVEVDGQEVRGPSPRIGFMLQKDLLLPWRTVLENVTIGLEMQRVRDTSGSTGPERCS